MTVLDRRPRADRRPSMATGWWVGVAGLCVVVLGGTAVAALLRVGPPDPTMLAGFAFAVVGGLLVSRRPDNAIGRLLVAMAAVWASGELAYHYREGVAVGSWPDREFVAWLEVWVWFPMLPLAAWVIALFPTGRVASDRMRWLLRVVVVVATVHVVGWMVVPVGPGRSPFGDSLVGNPWAVEGLAPLGAGVAAVDYLQVALTVLVVGDLVTRWRRSDGVERQQMRWLALWMVVFIVLLTIAMAIEGFGAGGLANDWAWWGTWLLGLGSLPAAIGIAVTRYRLFEIDRLISRTVTYAAVVAVLAGVYVAGVLVLGNLLPRQSDLGVAASTLAVAALFLPLRRRVHRTVERRFNRSRYDAERELERFAGRLRDELDLDELSGDLLQAVASTVHPSTAGLWIRGPAP